MLSEVDFCDYDTCVALKELGYKVPTSAYYMPKNSQLIFAINQFRGGSAIDCFYSNNSLPKECIASDFIDAPTLWEVQKWLREEKEVYVTVIPEYNYYCPVKGVKYRLEVAYWKDDKFGYETIESLDEECPYTIITFDSYEETLLKGIRISIKILQNKQK